MTEQERAIITAVGDAIRSNPTSWEAIPDEQKQVIIEIMRPRPAFSADQRSYLRHWWLSCNDSVVDAINKKLPRYHSVRPAIDVNGNKWLSADLFTDAVEPQMRLHAILPTLLGLELHYLEDDVWPVLEDEI